MKRLGFCALAIALTVPLRAMAQTSDTITACVDNKKGDVRIVASSAACTPKEHSVSWNVTGPSGPQGFGALKVVDSNDEIVGPFSDADRGFVILAIGGASYAVPFNVDGVPSCTGQTLLYQTNDCTGSAYFFAGGPRPLVLPTSTGRNGLVYYPTGAVQQVSISSFTTVSGGCASQSTCTQNPGGPSTIAAQSAGTLDFPSLGFTAPFHVVQ